MKLLLAVVLLSLPSFAATHFVGRTLEPTAKLVSYPVRHPVKTSKGVAKGVAATAKAIF